jgi:predicted nucleic acid-binding protein
MDAFDADVLIYAAVPGHPLGEQVAALFRSVAPATSAGLGSVLLLPEVLGRPLRDGAIDEVRILAALLARLDLRPVDRATAELATALSSRYRLKAADATHLATAVSMGADRFITNNKRDFPSTIMEIQVTYPADLAGPADGDISTVKDMFDELVRRGGDPVREVEAALRAMGYVPAVPERRGDKPREAYLGWVDPVRDYITGRFTLSLDSRTIWFSRLADQQEVRDMRGAYSTGGYVAFRIYEPGGVAHAMAAARKVKRQPSA